MAYVELNDGTRQIAEDFHTKKSAVRVFRVQTRDTAAAKAEVILNEGGLNSPYPGDAALIVDSITASDVGGVMTDVRFNYSSDRRASLGPRVNKDRLGYFSFRMSTTATDIKLPYAKNEPHMIPGTSGTTAQFQLLWTIHDDRIVPEARSQFWLNVAVSGWDLSKTAIVMGQVGKLHNIQNAGVLYLFRGADVVQRTDSSSAIYDVTYTWLGDPGTPAVPGPYPPEFDFPGIDRPPWHDWYAQPGDDPTTDRPTYGTVSRYDATDLGGWATLPGWPL